MSYASSAIKRLSNEHRRLQRPENRVREFYAAPLEENIFEWHFTLRGPGGDDHSLPYKNGIYHGALIFSRSYPLEPPDILFFTRSGRFAVREKICSTISSYHKELWQPTYDIALTLTALRHFMAQEDEFGLGAFPKTMIPFEVKEAWAAETWSFKCSICGRATRDVWEAEMEMYPETSPEKEAQVPKLPPRATATATAACATANPDEAGPQQDAPNSTVSSAASPMASPSTPQSPSPASTDAAGRVPEAAVAPGAPQNYYKATKGAQPSPTMAPSTPAPPSPSDATTTPPPAAAGALTAGDCSGTPTSQTGPHTSSRVAHQHEEESGAPVTEEGAMSEDTDANPTRVVRTPSMPASGGAEPPRPYSMPLEPSVCETLQNDAELAPEAARTALAPRVPAVAAAVVGDMAPPATPAVSDNAGAAAATGSPVSPAVAAVAPPPPAQRVVLSVNIMEVSIPLRILDRAIIFSFLLVVVILLRRGLCGLLTI